MAGDLEVYDAALALEPKGLVNTGVICHFNALLQALLSCTSVISAALGNRAYLAQTLTGRAFYDAVLWASGAGEPPGAEPPSLRLFAALVADLRRRRPSTAYGPSQESASEGLVLLLEMLEAPRPHPPLDPENPVARLFYSRYAAAVVCPACGQESRAPSDTAVQVNLFDYGESAAPPTTPAEFAAHLLVRISPVRDYRCGGCGAQGSCMRRDRLRLIPEVLVVAFNVYSAPGAQRAHYFPNRFELPGLGGRTLPYRCVAAVQHAGALSGGHYTASALRSGERVYHFDDLRVTQLEGPPQVRPAPGVYLAVFHAEPG
jgi:ubiquitin C-terminal hydrolase